jgi:hypothetical protein
MKPSNKNSVSVAAGAIAATAAMGYIVFRLGRRYYTVLGNVQHINARLCLACQNHLSILSELTYRSLGQNPDQDNEQPVTW